MSSMAFGYETNAGLTYRVLKAALPGSRMTLRYEAGVQWTGWREALNVIEGRGINRQIRRVYGALASRYREGDRIFLFGYSRGAYAVRSLAGMIERVGLLRREEATERNIRYAYRLYEMGADSAAFRQAHCHAGEVPIEMIGVWDTVKALGLRLPFIWRLSERKHSFHDHALGNSVKHGFHALAFHETRVAYAPVLWVTHEGRRGEMVQMWFRGTHGDVGGQLGGYYQARPLSNIPLVWMLEKAETLGLAMPDGWRLSFPQDPTAPSVGKWRGWAILFLARRRRVAGADPSERFHASLQDERGVAELMARAETVPVQPTEEARYAEQQRGAAE